MRHLIAFVSVLALTACDGPPRGSVQRQDIRQLESIVRIPADPLGKPRSLAEYRRYYTEVIVDGRRMIRGEFIVPTDDRKPGVYPVGRVEDFPSMFDGGCAVVNLLYDIAAKRIAEIACNGYA